MRLQNTFKAALVLILTATGLSAEGQNKAYQRKKPKVEEAQVTPVKGAPAKPSAAVPGAKPAAPAAESEKIDISELEQKYWAPKDTDFSVVQNRTYTKAKRFSASLLTGLLVSDPFNDGLTYNLSINYYFDERTGVEFIYHKGDLTDSDATSDFRKLSGGGTRPDFNRDTAFYGVGYNWVPFYAKMSFLGKKIIYFDMQFTPFLGISEYDQQTDDGDKSDSSLSYGFDITQYFFFSKNFAVRANYHNRFYNADVLNYSTGNVARKGESTNTSLFLFGLTYFF